MANNKYLALSEPLADEDDDGAALLVVSGRAVEAGRLLDRAQVLLSRPPQELLETAFERSGEPFVDQFHVGKRLEHNFRI